MARAKIAVLFLLVCAGVARTQEPRRWRVCVLDFSAETAERKAAGSLAQSLANGEYQAYFSVADADETRAAARGQGYAGSLNLSREEARDLGGALGCEFYVLGRVATKQRSSLAKPVYYESYAALLAVWARTGQLLASDVVSVEAQSAEAAENLLATALAEKERTGWYGGLFYATWNNGRNAVAARPAAATPPIEDVPEEDTPAARGLRLPAPYRRLQPPYPATAARVEAAGIVDVLVSLDVQGEVTNVEVVRWAGFGLDEATVETVRKMHFRPAQRDGVAIPLRVLLRYNFRPKPKEAEEKQK